MQFKRAGVIVPFSCRSTEREKETLSSFLKGEIFGPPTRNLQELRRALNIAKNSGRRESNLNENSEIPMVRAKEPRTALLDSTDTEPPLPAAV